MGAIFVLEFIYMVFFWQVATFRVDRSPEIVQTLNDMAWIQFVGLTSTATVQAVAMGVAMLGDRGRRTVFPRWAGYFNLWCAALFTPGCVNVFFKDGPLAWNGLLAWYLPVAVFGLWVVVNAVLVLKGISRQAEDDANGRGCARGAERPRSPDRRAVGWTGGRAPRVGATDGSGSARS